MKMRPTRSCCDVPVMDAEIAAPVQGLRLDPARCALREYLPHELQ